MIQASDDHRQSLIENPRGFYEAKRDLLTKIIWMMNEQGPDRNSSFPPALSDIALYRYAFRSLSESIGISLAGLVPRMKQDKESKFKNFRNDLNRFMLLFEQAAVSHAKVMSPALRNFHALLKGFLEAELKTIPAQSSFVKSAPKSVNLGYSQSVAKQPMMPAAGNLSNSKGQTTATQRPSSRSKESGQPLSTQASNDPSFNSSNFGNAGNSGQSHSSSHLGPHQNFSDNPNYPGNETYTGQQAFVGNQSYAGYQGPPGNQSFGGQQIYPGYQGYATHQSFAGHQGYPGYLDAAASLGNFTGFSGAPLMAQPFLVDPQYFISMPTAPIPAQPQGLTYPIQDLNNYSMPGYTYQSDPAAMQFAKQLGDFQFELNNRIFHIEQTSDITALNEIYKMLDSHRFGNFLDPMLLSRAHLCLMRADLMPDSPDKKAFLFLAWQLNAQYQFNLTYQESLAGELTRLDQFLQFGAFPANHFDESQSGESQNDSASIRHDGESEEKLAEQTSTEQLASAPLFVSSNQNEEKSAETETVAAPALAGENVSGQSIAQTIAALANKDVSEPTTAKTAPAAAEAISAPVATQDFEPTPVSIPAPAAYPVTESATATASAIKSIAEKAEIAVVSIPEQSIVSTSVPTAPNVIISAEPIPEQSATENALVAAAAQVGTVPADLNVPMSPSGAAEANRRESSSEEPSTSPRADESDEVKLNLNADKADKRSMRVKKRRAKKAAKASAVAAEIVKPAKKILIPTLYYSKWRIPYLSDPLAGESEAVETELERFDRWVDQLDRDTSFYARWNNKIALESEVQRLSPEKIMLLNGLFLMKVIESNDLAGEEDRLTQAEELSRYSALAGLPAWHSTLFNLRANLVLAKVPGDQSARVVRLERLMKRFRTLSDLSKDFEFKLVEQLRVDFDEVRTKHTLEVEQREKAALAKSVAAQIEADRIAAIEVAKAEKLREEMAPDLKILTAIQHLKITKENAKIIRQKGLNLKTNPKKLFDTMLSEAKKLGTALARRTLMLDLLVLSSQIGEFGFNDDNFQGQLMLALAGAGIPDREMKNYSKYNELIKDYILLQIRKIGPARFEVLEKHKFDDNTSIRDFFNFLVHAGRFFQDPEDRKKWNARLLIHLTKNREFAGFMRRDLEALILNDLAQNLQNSAQLAPKEEMNTDQKSLWRTVLEMLPEDADGTLREDLLSRTKSDSIYYLSDLIGRVKATVVFVTSNGKDPDLQDNRFKKLFADAEELAIEDQKSFYKFLAEYLPVWQSQYRQVFMIEKQPLLDVVIDKLQKLGVEFEEVKELITRHMSRAVQKQTPSHLNPAQKAVTEALRAKLKAESQRLEAVLEVDRKLAHQKFIEGKQEIFDIISHEVELSFLMSRQKAGSRQFEISQARTNFHLSEQSLQDALGDFRKALIAFRLKGLSPNLIQEFAQRLFNQIRFPEREEFDIVLEKVKERNYLPRLLVLGSADQFAAEVGIEFLEIGSWDISEPVDDGSDEEGSDSESEEEFKAPEIQFKEAAIDSKQQLMQYFQITDYLVRAEKFLNLRAELLGDPKNAPKKLEAVINAALVLPNTNANEVEKKFSAILLLNFLVRELKIDSKYPQLILLARAFGMSMEQLEGTWQYYWMKRNAYFLRNIEARYTNERRGVQLGVMKILNLDENIKVPFEILNLTENFEGDVKALEILGHSMAVEDPDGKKNLVQLTGMISKNLDSVHYEFVQSIAILKAGVRVLEESGASQRYRKEVLFYNFGKLRILNEERFQKFLALIPAEPKD